MPATGLKINNHSGNEYLADQSILQQKMDFINECIGAESSEEESGEEESAGSAESESDAKVLLGLQSFKKKKLN